MSLGRLTSSAVTGRQAGRRQREHMEIFVLVLGLRVGETLKARNSFDARRNILKGSKRRHAVKQLEELMTPWRETRPEFYLSHHRFLKSDSHASPRFNWHGDDG